MSTAQLYGKFSKIEQLADGTLYVEGIASSEAKDAVGERILASAMKAALPDYLKFPALREMHETWAAGRTVRAEVLADGTTHISAKVVDTEAARKVREGVYNGFSIGGNVTRRNADDRNIIEGLTLTEISLVDRPANPDCIMQLVKLSKETSMDPRDALKKFLGQETMDARMALDALSLLQSLLSMEATEGHPEAPAQMADLQAAIARIKTFIASEILEADPAEASAAPVAIAETKTLPPATDGNAPPAPTEAQQQQDKAVAETTGDLAKMDKQVAAAMDRAMQSHRNKMERMHKKLEALAAEFAELGWKGDPAESEEPPAEEEAPAEEGKADEVVDADAPPADAAKPDPAGENPDAPPAEQAKKESAAKAGELRKRLTDAEAAASTAGEMLAKVMKERDELVARIAAKGALRAISKVDDSPSYKDEGDEKPKTTHDLIKAAHAKPITLI